MILKLILRIQMKFCAWRARTWDDRYVIGLRAYDCGWQLAEYMYATLRGSRNKHEQWATKYHWLERKWKRL